MKWIILLLILIVIIALVVVAARAAQPSALDADRYAIYQDLGAVYDASEVFGGAVTGAGDFLREISTQHATDKLFTLRDEPRLAEFVPRRDDGSRPPDFCFTPAAVYSLSTPADADKTVDIIAKRLGRPARELTITDAIACVGGNTLAFARRCRAVTAVEIDPTTCEALRRNLKLYDHNVTVHCGDFIELARENRSSGAPTTLTGQVVFVDPPWGGLDYDAAERVRCPLGRVSLAELVDLLPRGAAVVFKLPLNFDLGWFVRAVTRRVEVIPLRRYQLLYLAPDG